jgi:hypothetical protein
MISLLLRKVRLAARAIRTLTNNMCDLPSKLGRRLIGWVQVNSLTT